MICTDHVVTRLVNSGISWRTAHAACRLETENPFPKTWTLKIEKVVKINRGQFTDADERWIKLAQNRIVCGNFGTSIVETSASTAKQFFQVLNDKQIINFIYFCFVLSKIKLVIIRELKLFHVCQVYVDIITYFRYVAKRCITKQTLRHFL